VLSRLRAAFNEDRGSSKDLGTPILVSAFDGTSVTLRLISTNGGPMPSFWGEVVSREDRTCLIGKIGYDPYTVALMLLFLVAI